MANYSVDLFPYHLMMVIGILGLVAVFLYILFFILKFIVQRKKKNGKEMDMRPNEKTPSKKNLDSLNGKEFISK